MAVTRLNLRGVTGFPDSLTTTLRYVETLTFEGAPFVKFEWAANNLIDVNLSGSGHQPMYFDEYTNLYDRWYVSSVSVRMTCINLNLGAAVHVCMFPAGLVTILTSIGKAQEQPHSRSIFLGPAGVQKGVLTHSMTTKKIRGETVQDDTFSGGTQVTAPVRQWFWETAVESIPAIDVNCIIKFDFRFRVRFFKRHSQEQS